MRVLLALALLNMAAARVLAHMRLARTDQLVVALCTVVPVVGLVVA
jgi:hypothetical protein